MVYVPHWYYDFFYELKKCLIYQGNSPTKTKIFLQKKGKTDF